MDLPLPENEVGPWCKSLPYDDRYGIALPSIDKNPDQRIVQFLLQVSIGQQGSRKEKEKGPQPRASEPAFQQLICQLHVALVLSQILGMSDVVAKTPGKLLLCTRATTLPMALWLMKP